MRVAEVTLHRIGVPFRRSFAHASHVRAEAEAVLVAVTDEDGTTGWGEAVPRAYVTGETLDSVAHRTGPALARALMGRRFDGFDAVIRWLSEAHDGVGEDLAALGAFDLALLDLAGKRFGCSAARALERPAGPPLPAGVVIGFERPTESLARYCATLRLQGHRHVKVKVGRDDDLERLRAVARVWKDLPLRLDANEAWTPQEAVDRLCAWKAEIPIASIEQPVAKDDLEGMARVRREAKVAVMADESVRTLDDARRLIEADAVDVFNVRLGKNGGLVASRRLVESARRAGVAVHLGTMVGETGVLSSAAELFGRCTTGFECLDGKGQNAFLLEVDILRDSGHTAFDPNAPGLGTEIEIGRIELLARGTAIRVSQETTT